MNQTISIWKLPIFLWLVVSMVLLHLNGYAQEKQITGTITAIDNSAPLPGATVQLKTKSRSTSANEKGQFSIRANTGDILVFKIIGFQQQEVMVGSSNIINVSLRTEVTSLNEVVIGYGKKSKGNVTGSISSISQGLICAKRNPLLLTRPCRAKLPGLWFSRYQASRVAAYLSRYVACLQ
ncbi:carboxypeptidase-like regulatory domain-containing protein [Pedobacter sp. NJ-S-72]